ncbi:bifunctional adenosylcobinamide kinase/adenosylcobinamide-phosphate guanylyltransferase [Shewanella litorisediminis]|uniref:Bifunctional adenosylcobalamin biosynthesis protein n=1 Tax=Shewanella litorisediminis TaxID=1173586 RepID=A0ABX7G5B8_9GAMM|nr:bifunctional adenosylcobinamide kinase/adenosylcobinamide-phosphate guanylyltransferase [Shewanella litorisediminis]MCL2917383.1 bifunctional adenosylcobinamide kinase/adenosylcobinamide-phosphate guanylyltransferase [Shewanella litorisediminis]QRH02520.1 bifunctional adenosylcobinamide kinase/adenosylcobinamide-phosphate guanylyltransferase [Shewanella litorisediminis]
MIHLVLGGARSGKSRFAENELARVSPRGIYLATATAGDDEMAARIARHQQDRLNAPCQWQLIEAPLDLAAHLRALSGEARPVLVDCLTLWLTNRLMAEPQKMAEARQELLNAIGDFHGQLWLVSNEVGSGIVPLGVLSRQFVDEAGWLNQAIAALADRVTLVVAGLPLALKGTAANAEMGG